MSSRHLQKHIHCHVFENCWEFFLGNLLFVMGEKSGKKTKGNYWENYSQFFLALSQYCRILVFYYPNMLKLALVFSVPSYNMVYFSQYGSF